MHLKMLSAKWRPFCPGGDELNRCLYTCRYMLGLAALPAVIQFIGFLFLPETPRWLVSKGNMKKAIEVLMLLRGHPHVEEEAEQIRRTLAEDRGRLVESGQGRLGVQVDIRIMWSTYDTVSSREI